MLEHCVRGVRRHWIVPSACSREVRLLRLLELLAPRVSPPWRFYGWLASHRGASELYDRKEEEVIKCVMTRKTIVHGSCSLGVHRLVGPWGSREAHSSKGKTTSRSNVLQATWHPQIRTVSKTKDHLLGSRHVFLLPCDPLTSDLTFMI